MFCKECIYAALLSQKNEIKRKIKEWEEQEQKKKDETEKKIVEAHEKELKDFQRVDSGLVTQRKKIWRPPGDEGIRPSFIPDGYEAWTTPEGKLIYLDKQ